MVESGAPVPEGEWPISDEGYGPFECAVPDGETAEVGDPVPEAGNSDRVLPNEGD